MSQGRGLSCFTVNDLLHNTHTHTHMRSLCGVRGHTLLALYRWQAGDTSAGGIRGGEEKRLRQQRDFLLFMSEVPPVLKNFNITAAAVTQTQTWQPPEQSLFKTTYLARAQLWYIFFLCWSFNGLPQSSWDFHCSLLSWGAELGLDNWT